MKILIFGASGSGTTTLGQELAQGLNYTHLDADDYYWEKTDRPFQLKVPLKARNENILKDFNSNDSLILSGSLVSWGEHWKTSFDLAIFLFIPNDVRMRRLKEREHARYGGLLNMDQQAIEDSRNFLEWADKYDNEHFDGRSITQHKLWIEKLSCPVVSIVGDTTTEVRISRVLEAIKLVDQPKSQLAKDQSS